MSFLTSLALLVGVLIGAPIAAHLLRRKRAAEIALPTASLLAATPPTARRRSALEDRALLGIRALAILLLAILGATPFIRCSHVALLRKDGASVAMVIVLDDSLSMRAAHPNGGTRFARAKKAAADLLDGAEPGDAFAIVLAGGDPRVHLASTTDVGAAKAALADVTQSDRPTDLSASLAIAKDILKGAPQPDRRVVLLSDLADGDADGPTLDTGEDVALWYPLADLEAKSEADCAIVGTERRDSAVDVTVRCSGAQNGARAVDVVSASDPKTVVATGSLSPGAESVAVKIPTDAPAELDARLEPGDAIAEDDVAPVAHKTKEAQLGVLVDAAASRVQTGGPPPVEQAFTALELGSVMRPIASIPEHIEELAAYSGLVLDDPPGLTPEERRTVIDWVESGGMVLVSLGRKATSAPLGAGFGALVPGVVRWSQESPRGAKQDTCGFFGPSAQGLVDIAPKGRSQLPAEAMKDSEVLCAFADDQPLLVRRQLGKGFVYVSTLPFDFDNSEIALRPAFLVLLDRFVEIARTGGGAKTVEVGQRFVFVGSKLVQGELLGVGEKKPIKLEIPPGPAPRVDAGRIGRYNFIVDGASDTRVAVAPPREIDLRPRSLAPRAKDPSLGGEARKVDASPYVALGLLGLLLLELVVRLFIPPGQTAVARTEPEGAP